MEEYIDAVFRHFQLTFNLPLKNKTVGIVGVGNVGKRIIGLCEKYGMRVLLCDPPRERAEGTANFATLGEIANKSDIITFHTPLTKQGADKTYHMCDVDFLSKLKPNTILINAARGGIIDENALKQFPQLMANSTIDCWENEPNIDPELCVKVALSTPHIAGYSLQGKANATTSSVQALARFFHIDQLKKWEVPPLAADNTNVYDVLSDSHLLRDNICQFELLRSNYKLR